MRADRLGAAVGVAVLVALPLAACQSEQDSYCSTLKDERGTLQQLGGRAQKSEDGVLADSIEVFEQLRDAAPEDIADEWDTFLRAWQGLASAMDDAGVDESLFTAGKQPDGVSDDEFAAIQAAADKLRSGRVVEAATGIEQHAQDVCKIDLSGSQLG